MRSKPIPVKLGQFVRRRQSAQQFEIIGIWQNNGSPFMLLGWFDENYHSGPTNRCQSFTINDEFENEWEVA